MKRGIIFAAWTVSVITLVSFCLPSLSYAADTPGDFNLQVTPSPLVTTVKPGVKTQLELKIRNAGSTNESLKIEPRSFIFDSKTGKVDLQDDILPSVAPWISFSSKNFIVQPGQWFSEQVVLNVPSNAGFSYSFALVISRQNVQKPQNGTREITGSLAVFTLVNVDKPGAKSKLDVVSFTSEKRLYEYLPAELRVRFRNTGNTIVQPYGNIFVQRGNSSKKPLATLGVNDTKGYILPGTERTVSAIWNDGFATYQTSNSNNGGLDKHLEIDWSKLSHFRIGHYTANLVAVYSDGSHDVPINGVVGFWVIPWRAILSLIATMIILIAFFRWRGKRRTDKAVRRALAARTIQDKTSDAKETHA